MLKAAKKRARAVAHVEIPTTAGARPGTTDTQFRLVNEQNVDAIIWADAETGIITDCNQQAEKLTEHTRAELIGLHQTRLHPTDRDYNRVFKQHAAAQFSSMEAEVLTRTGKRIPVFISATVVQMGAQRLVQGVFHDITERKRAEAGLREAKDVLEVRVRERTAELQGANAALRDSEEQMQALVDHSPVAIALIHANGRIAYVNRTFVKWFGYELDAIPTEAAWFETAFPEAAYRQSLLQSWRAAVRRARQIPERIPPMEMKVRCKDGSWKQATAAGAIVQGQLLVIYNDITDRKLAEEQLEKLSLALMKSQDLERRRIARELHDSVAQQLVVQLLSLKQLQNRLGNSPEELRQLAADVLQLGKECLREVRTISFLLHPPHLQELGLAGAVQYYAQEFGARSGIKVLVHLPRRTIRLTEEQELALYRVVQEGLSNIHRHSGSLTAEVRLVCLPEKVRLEVRDTGKGMVEPAALLGQVQNATYGIGIPGMRERLRHLGGQLEILPGQPGTRVIATLPRGQRKTQKV